MEAGTARRVSGGVAAPLSVIARNEVTKQSIYPHVATWIGSSLRSSQ